MRICHNIQGNVAYVQWFVLSIVMIRMIMVMRMMTWGMCWFLAWVR